jgi:hypothetical protein
LVRFAFAGLFVNALAVACVVSDGDDKDDDNTACDPGAYKDCTCANGDEGTKRCNASGSGYAACDCSDTNVGGGSNGGGGDGNTPTSGSGGSMTSYGGEAAGGAGGDGTGPGPVVGGAGGSDGSGGAGGDGSGLVCEPDAEACQNCIQNTKCCAEWAACSAEQAGDCEQEFFNILACAQVERGDRDVIPADLELCGLDEGEGDAWSEGLLPTTKALVDCIGGGEGWEERTWNQLSCKAECFDQAE